MLRQEREAAAEQLLALTAGPSGSSSRDHGVVTDPPSSRDIQIWRPSPAPADDDPSMPSPAPARDPSPAPGGPDTPSERPPGRSTGAETQGTSDLGPSLGGWCQKPPMCEPSQELLDVVGLCNQAHRLRRGHIVWLAWEGCSSKRGRKWIPCHGSTLLAFTPQGAREFEKHLLLQDPDHLDVILSRWLVGGADEMVGGCFLLPTAGSYACHVSGCEPNLLRESSFGRSHVGDGFRGTNVRWLCGFRDKGGPVYLEEVVFDSPRFDWITQRPPRHWYDMAYWWRLWQLGWIDEDGEWHGPWWKVKKQRQAGSKQEASSRGWYTNPAPVEVGGTSSRTRGGASSWWEQEQATDQGSRFHWDRSWQDLCEDPDGYSWRPEIGYSPLTRLQQQLVCDPPHFEADLNGSMSQRVLRLRRRALHAYQLRRFGDDSEA